VIFDGIEWDENNLDHARRRVTAAEIEEVITNATSAIVESPLVSVWIRTEPLVACRAAPDHTTPNASRYPNLRRHNSPASATDVVRAEP